VELRKAGLIQDVLLLLEHTPVVTLGRNAKAANVLASAEQLEAREVKVFECDRGGDVTFHGPGQIVGYPIFDLRGFPPRQSNRKNLGAVDYVRRLEEVLTRTCADFGIAAERVPGLTGVWTIADEQRPQGKIAAIGVHISRGVTSHGFALNVSTDLSFFDLIIPCGITAKPVTSMEQQLGRRVSQEEVTNAICRNFGAVFQSQILWLESLDALLGEAVGVPMKVPEELRQLKGEEETFWA